jgi:UDP-N-acetyl-D-glucosamine dehydrogenase
MRVGIIGLGYVGVPLAVAFAEAGHDVAGVDADHRKVESLSEGVTPGISAGNLVRL